MTETTGTCGRCQQTRPVEPYQPRHTHWYEPDSYSCHWCMRWPVPLLCAECTVLEVAEEKVGRPRSLGEQRVTEFLFAAAALDEQRQAS